MNIKINNNFTYKAKQKYSKQALNDKIITSLKAKVNDTNLNTSPQMKNIYNDSIKFLKKDINKENFIDQLFSNLNIIYKSNFANNNLSSNKLTNKEAKFFNKTFPEIESLDSIDDISNEDLINHIKLLI